MAVVVVPLGVSDTGEDSIQRRERSENGVMGSGQVEGWGVVPGPRSGGLGPRMTEVRGGVEESEVGWLSPGRGGVFRVGNLKKTGAGFWSPQCRRSRRGGVCYGFG